MVVVRVGELGQAASRLGKPRHLSLWTRLCSPHILYPPINRRGKGRDEFVPGGAGDDDDDEDHDMDADGDEEEFVDASEAKAARRKPKRKYVRKAQKAAASSGTGGRGRGLIPYTQQDKVL